MNAYLNFTLTIAAKKTDNSFPVSVTESPAGTLKQEVSIPLPFDELELERIEKIFARLLQADKKANLNPEIFTVQRFGKKLFLAVFTWEIRHLFDESLRIAKKTSRRLQLKLVVKAVEFRTIPWEFLYDPRESDFLLHALPVSITRSLQTNRPSDPIPFLPPARILHLTGQSAADSDEQNEMEAHSSPAEEPVRTLFTAAAESPEDIEETLIPADELDTLHKVLRLHRQNPHQFLFVHGRLSFNAQNKEYELRFSSTDDAQTLSVPHLTRIIRSMRGLGVLFIAAESDSSDASRVPASLIAQDLIDAGVPAVVFLPSWLTTENKISFAAFLMREISENRSLLAGMDALRQTFHQSKTSPLAWGLPALFVQSENQDIFTLIPADELADGKVKVRSLRFRRLEPPPPLKTPVPMLAAPPVTIPLPYIIKGGTNLDF
jgi:hypothetical protein